MLFPVVSFKEFTPLEKRALFKIAIELVKADNKIHSKEISVLDKLQADLELAQEELDVIHYSPLSVAVSTIKAMKAEQVESILNLFIGIMKADSNIDFEEKLLLSAVVMACSKDSCDWASVISATDVGVELSDKQIVYLEKEFCATTHGVFDDKYDNLLISKAFGDIGLQFFYLPNVLSDLGLHTSEESGKFALLQKSMSYLMPAGDKFKVNNLENALETFDTGTFFRVICSRLNLEPDFFPFSSFLLIKIRDSVVLDDSNTVKNSVDFFCLDLSKEVKKRILEFVSKFDEQTYMLPYEGYYKLLYDYFSSESKINSDVVIDLSFNFCLENLDNLKVQFESAPQSKTLYLLLLKAGKKGIRQDTFIKAADFLKSVDTSKYLIGGDLNLELFKEDLLSIGSDWALLIFNTISIYQAVSTKNEQKENYLAYIHSIISHRSSLKTYVNKGFSSITGLSNPEQYFIKFDKEFNSYSIGASASLFHIVESKGQIVPLSHSLFWQFLR